MIIIYGIPNCDTTKKALLWLKKNKISHEFHDYKLKGISAKKLEEWIGIAGMDKIFNKNSTTWKEMAANFSSVPTAATAVKLMQQHTSIIKRPIAEKNGAILTGFKEKEYETQFLSS
ncbi:MAG: Spx/MgsR family RNA polymerase-binding regulatory protein [Ferruginibacter sp.]